MNAPEGAPHSIALLGACGRMGRAVEGVLRNASDLELLYRVDPALAHDPGPPRTAPDLDALEGGAVAGIIEFSSPEGTRHAAATAARLGCALVSGTTAIEEIGAAALREASRSVPVCWAPNFSLGIPLLVRAVREAAARLPRDWQIEIVDVHHAGKRDAPSGTALRLGEAWREERGGEAITGRSGSTGPRDPREIGLHAVRLGGVIGEHHVLLGGAGETIRTVHAVQDRSAFAAGAVEALRRILTRGPGWYEWEEILFGI
ncbi:MAG: 4-hydroxy-tetrahydrodipicolinate reductase [Candidatus Eisenbacteria bacterium]|nr:4-hydroxy-tetrahydrodipicolinate reductase [Candidatus Latescibacterota bacterium]MBD3301832.1 4-hydroxy-tetrahydrodipicolinate reductase [Candidatus Eisenbacteria bacterium]